MVNRRRVAGGAIIEGWKTGCTLGLGKSRGAVALRKNSLAGIRNRAASDAPTDRGGLNKPLLPGGVLGEFRHQGNRASVGAVVVGLGQGVAFGADLVVQLTWCQAVAGGQCPQAEMGIGCPLYTSDAADE